MSKLKRNGNVQVRIRERDISFSENFAYVLNEWPPMTRQLHGSNKDVIFII